MCRASPASPPDPLWRFEASVKSKGTLGAVNKEGIPTVGVRLSSRGAVHTGAMSPSIYIRVCAAGFGNTSIAINLLKESLIVSVYFFW